VSDGELEDILGPDGKVEVKQEEDVIEEPVDENEVNKEN